MGVGGAERTYLILDDVFREVNRSIAKHGDQVDVPFGTGPRSTPLFSSMSFLDDDMTSQELAVLFTQRTDVRFSNQGDRTGSWMDILTKEVFEAYAEDDPGTLRAELIQVAAVAVKWCEVIDRKTPEAAWRPDPSELC